MRHLVHCPCNSRRVIKLTYGLIMSHDNRTQPTYTHIYTVYSRTGADRHTFPARFEGWLRCVCWLSALSIRSICTSPMLPLDQPHSRVTESSTVSYPGKRSLSKQRPGTLDIVCEILTRKRLLFYSAFTTPFSPHLHGQSS